MKIENSQELVAAIEVNNALTAQLKEFQTTKEELEASKKEAEEANKSLAAALAENKELKDTALVAKKPEKVEPKVEAKNEPEAKTEAAVEVATKEAPEKTPEAPAKTEAAKPEPKVEEKAAPTADVVSVESLQQQIADLSERLAAFEEVAAEAIEDKEKAQGQFENLAQHLKLKGGTPEVIEAGDGVTEEKEASEAHETWLKLAKSKNPEDQRAARLMKKSNPLIGEAITAKIADTRIESAKPLFSAEDVAVFTKWRMILAEANLAKEMRQTKLQVEKDAEARRFHNKAENKTVIDACLASGLTA